VNGTRDPQRILVSRTDRLGDSLLTLPLCGLLKERFPRAEIFFLARAYTLPFVQLSTNLAQVLDWDALAARTSFERAAELRALRCDAVVHVFPRAAIAAAAWSAGIPRRIGTSRRWFHWLFCNERPAVSRRGSVLHEAQLNVLLAANLLGRSITAPPSLAALAAHYALRAPEPSPAVNHLLDPQRFNLVIHPLNSGSAAGWPVQRAADLIKILPETEFNVIISGDAASGAILDPWIATLSRPVRRAIGLDPRSYAALLGAAGGMVASSTGPLHLSAALGTRTVGLFPNAATSTNVQRWQPVGMRAEVLTPATACDNCARLGSACDCLKNIRGEDVAAVVRRWREERVS
jgi:ADP-heptose:LPS heptosyltransferase